MDVWMVEWAYCTLLQVPQGGVRKRVLPFVKVGVDYLLSICFPSGNLPSSLESAQVDKLVHWCHGCPGLVHLLAKAFTEFGKKEYLYGAVKCGEVVWSRGLLKKGFGLCHGTAGNAYTFLQLYRLTGQDEYLYKATMFGEWCLGCGQHECMTPDKPHSLFEGIAGTTHFYCDLLRPNTAMFPAFEIPNYQQIP